MSVPDSCRKSLKLSLKLRSFLLFNFVKLLQNNWVQGYSLAIGFFLEMIFYCVMGTKLTLEVGVIVNRFSSIVKQF